MKRIALIVCSVAVLGSNWALAGPATPRPPQQNPDVLAVSSANTAFACDLYSKLAGQTGNLFFSPYSIDTALAMVYAGARGQTAQQMAQVMHFALPPEKLNPAMGSLITDLNNGGKRGQMVLYQLVVANALWGQKGYPFDKAYQDLLKGAYQAGLNEVDFAQTEAARQEINTWVEKQTAEKIKDLIAQGVLSRDTRLVLTNAIYFKSNWANQFKKAATKNERFHVPGNKEGIDTPMMHEQERFPYAETDQLQMVELPYTGNGLSMLVLLPRKVDGLADLERNVTADNLAKWQPLLRSREVALALPKFKIETQFGLADTLRSMGMTDAFSPDKADLSGIATMEKLFIAAVIHKAYVAVDEEGTEAAAATAIAINTMAMPMPQEPVAFTADHPFVFVIRHRASGAVLFMGRVINPH